MPILVVMERDQILRLTILVLNSSNQPNVMLEKLFFLHFPVCSIFMFTAPSTVCDVRKQKTVLSQQMFNYMIDFGGMAATYLLNLISSENVV